MAENEGFGLYEDWKTIEGEQIRPPSNQDEIYSHHHDKINYYQNIINEASKALPHSDRFGTYSKAIHDRFRRVNPEIKEYSKRIKEEKDNLVNSLKLFRQGIIPFIMDDPSMGKATGNEGAAQEIPDVERRIEVDRFEREQGEIKSQPIPTLFDRLRKPFSHMHPYGSALPEDQALHHFRDFQKRKEAERELNQDQLYERGASLPMIKKEQGGIAGLAKHGRYGDSMLVHMAPEEVAGLASLTQNGVTINPETGLPEMFNLRELLPTIVGIGSAFIPGMQPLAAAALSGLTTAAVTEGDIGTKLGKGLLAGIGSWGMGKLGSMIGGAGAQAVPGQNLIGTDAFTGAEGIGETLISPTGTPNFTWAELPTKSPEAFQMLSRANVNTEPLYNQAMQKMGASLKAAGPTSGGWVPPTGVPPQIQPLKLADQSSVPLSAVRQSWTPPTYTGMGPNQVPVRDMAAADVLNPMLARSDAAALYAKADPFDKLGYLKEGLGQIDLESWSKAAPGKIAVGDLATPVAASMVGLGGMLPEPDYDDFETGRSSYSYGGPYVAERRRSRQLPPGYIPGVSPQLSYFAAGGTRGETVSGGLPTLYAWNGSTGDPSDPGDESGNIGGDSVGGGGGNISLAGQSDQNLGVQSGSEISDVIDFSESEDTTDDPHGTTSAGLAAILDSRGKGMSHFSTVNRGRDAIQKADPSISRGDAFGQATDINQAMNINTDIDGLFGGFYGKIGGIVADQMGRAGHQIDDPEGSSGPQGEVGGFDQQTFDAQAAYDRRNRLDQTQEEEEEGRIADAIYDYDRSLIAPPGDYRHGVDPQFPFYAMGGTRGKTVGGGLPTLYAQSGSYDFQAAHDDAIGQLSDPYGDSLNVFDGTDITTHDLPTPQIHQMELDIRGAQAADADKGFVSKAFDFTVPQGRVNPRTGAVDIKDSINPGAVIGTGLGLASGIPGLGTIGSQAGRSLMGLWSGQGGMGDNLNEIGVDIPKDYRRRYYAQEGTEGMTIEENIDVETAAEVPTGVAATTGIMEGAPTEVQDDVAVRLTERSVEEPQNPRERAIYDRAVLALQGELEPEVAQRAIDEFLEVFGPDALHTLQQMVHGERENGGTVETVTGETTVAEGEIQGPDIIAGKIVDPVTGEETANLRVGENEYIEPADSLARRAQVAGLPPTPENGAMIRGEEERMLRQAVG